MVIVYKKCKKIPNTEKWLQILTILWKSIKFWNCLKVANKWKTKKCFSTLNSNNLLEFGYIEMPKRHSNQNFVNTQRSYIAFSQIIKFQLSQDYMYKSMKQCHHLKK